MFGTASMIMMDETTSMAEVSVIIARFYEHESCGQCSQCREGTQWLYQIFKRIANGQGLERDIEDLERLARSMAPGKTICALSDAAAIPTLAVVKHFKDELMDTIRASLKTNRDRTEVHA